MLALHASSSQETVAMASAIIVTPVGTNLKIMNANSPENIFLDNVVMRTGPTMQRMGLEWLFRLYLQPWRIRRMLRLPHFVLAVLFSPSQGLLTRSH